MSRRDIDSRGEKAVGVFLDKYFYPQMSEARVLSYAKRIYAKNLQCKGIDILLGNEMKVDEKAQLYYINHPIESFAFEIDYYDEISERVVDGWFVDNNIETDAYLLMWIQKARTTHINRLVAEDFERIDADLLRRNRIKAYLERFGLHDRELKINALMMREKNIERLIINDECHMTYTVEGYAEKPINLVVKKRTLDKMSDNIFRISKNNVDVVR